MKILLSTLVIGALSVTALTVSPAVAAEAEAEAEQSKKPKKIKDRRHPDYVRCRSEPVIGSLARKRRICMTNKEWVEYTKAGTRESRGFVEDMQSGMDNNVGG
ncbi:hypothetical protein [Parasphingorhabdus sp.]|jgi:hypothetical protein|uniref:hypothetical protein n=1 Tax=Parasphingorhabdus sp. TaxID=2709688 RepID=UPI003D29722A